MGMLLLSDQMRDDMLCHSSWSWPYTCGIEEQQPTYPIISKHQHSICQCGIEKQQQTYPILATPSKHQHPLYHCRIDKNELEMARNLILLLFIFIFIFIFIFVIYYFMNVLFIQLFTSSLHFF
jgi:hypothetical protein